MKSEIGRKHMSYQSTGSTVVDFSQGQCGPAMYKPTAKSSCQMIYGGDVAPDWGGWKGSNPATLPGGDATPWNQGVTDFSGGSCGSGMIRPSPTAPCQQLVIGMPMGDAVTIAKNYWWVGVAAIGAYFLFKKKRKGLSIRTRKPGSNKLL